MFIKQGDAEPILKVIKPGDIKSEEEEEARKEAQQADKEPFILSTEK
jgi:hypothetical protein